MLAARLELSALEEELDVAWLLPVGLAVVPAVPWTLELQPATDKVNTAIAAIVVRDDTMFDSFGGSG